MEKTKNQFCWCCLYFETWSACLCSAQILCFRFSFSCDVLKKWLRPVMFWKSDCDRTFQKDFIDRRSNQKRYFSLHIFMCHRSKHSTKYICRKPCWVNIVLFVFICSLRKTWEFLPLNQNSDMFFSKRVPVFINPTIARMQIRYKAEVAEDIVIVGGGIAGLATSLGLHRYYSTTHLHHLWQILMHSKSGPAIRNQLFSFF